MEEEHPIELINLGSFDILQNITNSQTQNGFKHGDYNRYRKYCSKKVAKMRHQIKFKYGRNKYVSKDLLTEKPNEMKLIPILLYQTERNWSYALDLKSSLQTIAKNQDNRRKKFHIRKKFAKAIQYSQKLENLCLQRSDNKTALESKAYNHYIKGLYYFEIKEYEKAQNNFLESRQIWSQLSKIADSYMQVLFNDKLDQIDQNIRYCNHQLQTGIQIMSIEEILEMKRKNKDDVFMNEQIEQMLQESRAQKLSDVKQKEFVFQGEKISINNQKVILQQQKIEEYQINLEKLDIQQFEQKMQIYIEIFACLDEINKLLLKEKEEQKEQEQIQKIISKTIQYFHLQKQCFVLDRNMIHLLNSERKFIQENHLEALGQQISQRQIKTKIVQPLELIRWCEITLQSIRQIQEIEKNQQDLNVLKQLEFQDMLVRNFRCLYIGCLYYQNAKYLESASIFENVENLLLNTRQFYENSFKLKFDYEQHLRDKMDQINQYKSKAIIKLQEFKIKNEQDVQLEMQKVNLDGRQQQQKSLSELLRSDVITNQNQITVENMKNMSIIDMNPQLKMIESEPIFLDLSYNHLELPNVSGKIQQQGFLKSLSKFSFFGK